MLVEVHDRLNNPERRSASRLVVYDSYGNAIATFLQLDKRNIDVRIRGQPGFEEALQFLGIRQTVICDVLEAKKLPSLKP